MTWRFLRKLGRRFEDAIRGPLRRLRLDRGRGACAALVLLAVVMFVLVAVFGASAAPSSMLVLPVVLGVLALRLVQLRLVIVVVIAGCVIDTFVVGVNGARIAVIVVVILVGAISLYTVSVRERLGIVGTRGDSMLSELRDRLIATSGIAEPPPGWQLEVASRASGGTAFGGDFLVARAEGDLWELVLVDVSGKGLEAGTRALQLSGALGGLLGAVPPKDFLPQANRYLLRQNWDEGFATAVHFALDTCSGVYHLRSAGHPPSALFAVGSGEWSLAGAEGPALGLVSDAAFREVVGVLHPGDALMLYTDGVVERPDRDLSVGIDKLLGEATGLIVHGFRGGSARLLRQVAPIATDDRAVVLLWRD